MVIWSDLDIKSIVVESGAKDKSKFKYENGPLRFQIPRGMCTWGVSAYKSLQLDLSTPEFFEWWRSLETTLCPQEPFVSNLKDGKSLRLKIDEGVYIFDSNSKQVTPEIMEGLFKGAELSCIIEIGSNYFFKDNWGLTVRIYQVKYYNEPEAVVTHVAPVESGLQKGVCAFI